MAESFDKNIVDKDEYPQTAELEARCGLAAKWRWRRAGQGTGRPNLVCGPVQVCWEQFARYFDVELRQVLSWRRSAAAGWSGVPRTTCPRNWSSTSTTWVGRRPR